MTLGLGISGIGNSMMGLGNFGLGLSGSYGSYDSYMPSMMGMNGSLFGANGMTGLTNAGMMPGMTGMAGMMGMYNPLYYIQLQQQAEEMQLNHAGNMHSGVLNNEVRANRETDQALIKKILTNSDVQQGVQNLYNKVREGDQDGICAEFDKLKEYVSKTYRDELTARSSKSNSAISVTQIIEAIYGNVITAQSGDGQTHDLRSDIKRYGDGALMNGFLSGFRADHHQRYVDETLNHCFGLDIDHRGSKDKRKEIASYAGRTASVLEKGVYGTGAGVLIAGLGTSLLKGFTPDPEKVIEKKVDKAIHALPANANADAIRTARETATNAAKSSLRYKAGNFAKNTGWFSSMKKLGKAGFIAGMALDILWQLSGSNPV